MTNNNLPSVQLGPYKSAIMLCLSKIEDENYIQRLREKDFTLWGQESDSIIVNSLGWIDVIEKMIIELPQLKQFYKEIIQDGFEHVVLMGMGGSSLAPLVFNRIFTNKGKLKFHILDSTDSITIKNIESSINVEKTLFIVASKSGTTSEPLAFLDYFYNIVEKIIPENPGKHFIAITDPETQLTQLAKEKSFLRVFTNFSDIGGRYSALSYFGILPAILMGIDAKVLLENAQKIKDECFSDINVYQNPGVLLGGILGELARLGRNKLTIVIPESYNSLGIWLEQLIAESTGKNGIGILPDITSKLGAAKLYGEDRLFVYFNLINESNEALTDKLNYFSKLGHPVITIPIESPMDVGREFFRWEVATAIAGAVLGINPFDQENVQESKVITNRLLRSLEETGSLQSNLSVTNQGSLKFYSNHKIDNSKELLGIYFSKLKAGDYISIQAFITENSENDKALAELKRCLLEKFNVTTTVGYGPRYLHSTGQYHKGGPNNGVFILLTTEDKIIAEIPGRSYNFSNFKYAQAIGDYEALINCNRKALQIDLGSDVFEGLNMLNRTMKEYQINQLLPSLEEKV